jgi:anti-sigma B factor antagonist
VVSEERAASSLTVAVEHRTPWAVVRLSGELDHRSYPDLADHLQSLLAEMALPRICVDLSGLQFCDSSGLACLVMAWKASRERSGELALLRPSGEVARLLTMLGLAASVPVMDELPELSGSSGQPG